MKRTTVLNITEEGRGGGALFRLVTMSKVLMPEIKTIVVCPKTANDFIERLDTEGIEYDAIGMRHLTKNLYGLVAYICTFFFDIYRIVKLIRKHQPDIAHCNGSWQIKGIIAAKITKTRSVWHMNDTHQPRVIKWLFNYFSDWPDGYIYASKKTRSYYLKINPQLTEKPHWIISAPVRDFKNTEINTTALDQYQETKILTIGYINANKGIHQLIDAAHLLKTRTSETIQWFVAGPILSSQSIYYKELQSLVAKYELDNFHFLGFQSDVHSLLSSTDIYICPSYNESSPIAVWEAMAAGKLVISNDVGDVKEIFEKDKCGICIPNNNADIIVDAIQNALGGNIDLDGRKKSAIKAANKRFKSISIKPKYLEAYRSLSV